MGRIKYAILFTLVLVVSMFSINTIEHLFAKDTMARDAKLLSQRFDTVISASMDKLSALPEITLADLNCDDAFVKNMRRSVFDAHFVRWVGITKDKQVYCETDTILRDIVNVNMHRILEDYSVGIIDVEGGAHHELILVRHMNDINYVASIIPLDPRYFIPTDCKNCLEYTVSFDSDPLLSFGFNSFVGKEFISDEVVVKTKFYEAHFKLSGNFEFYNQYRALSWVVSGVLSVLLASLLTYVYMRWQQYSVSTKQQILNGIKNNEFIPFYQPIIDSRNDSLVGCEVLMRWKKEDGTVIPPNQFIPYAEAEGLIVPMTTCMIERMVSDIQQLGKNKPSLFFSINLVPKHLENDDLFQKINQYISDKAIGENRFSLEITERLPIKDLTKARTMLDKFYALGIDLKLDDAGTGYGGFSYVQNLGISTLKIDKMFVDTIGNDDNFNAKTIEAIISFSKKSGLGMIAEGVEEKEQLEYLAEKGVYLIQGYVYSKPLNAEDFFNKG